MALATLRLQENCEVRLLIHGHVPGATRWFEIVIWIAWIVVRVSVSVAMIEEETHGLDRDGEAESLAKSDLHVRDAHDFAGEIEKRAAAVAGIDLRRGLQVKL